MDFTFTPYRKAFLLTILFVLGSLIQLYATHLRAGEITVERVNCNTREFRITITVYTNTKNTTVLFGGEQDILDFGDGTPVKLVPETPNTIRLDLNPDGSVATASFTTTHTYAGPGRYVISYREPNRNANVLNMSNSVQTTFYLETVIEIDPFLGCNNTPVLLVPPIDRACPGVAWFHNPGAYDPDGDSLSFEMVVPFSDRNTSVVNYRSPNHASFYTNYNTANEAGSGPPTFSINPVTGTLTWDAPGAVGEYNIAFHVVEWRKIGSEWFQVGYVRRDMQIHVEDCKNERPDLIIPKDICVEAGTRIEETIIGTDPDNHNVKIEAFSVIFDPNAPEVLESPATYSPVPGVSDFRPQPATTTFTWDTKCSHVKDQPYQVVFKITDNPPNGPKLVTFKTWFITVVGPAPKWVDAQKDDVKRTVSLEWESYFCKNAETIQVWRKVDGVEFTPANCQTGMPDYLGYELITTLPANATSYKDTNNGKGLSAGAKYCYRLVAVFPLPRGGESYVSEDICLDPFPINVPVITNVSVLRTDLSSGQIEVKWLRPIEQIDPNAEIVYEVYRAEGFTRGTDSTLVHSLNGGTDTEFTFTNTGLNTEQTIYNYSIAAYYDAVSKDNFLGNSSIASSVRLDAESGVESIQLNWSAVVPWSNQVKGYVHDIYRGPEGATEDQLQLLATVDPTTSGLVYVDQGPLEVSTIYCYRVKTRGSYGNDKLPEPLENFSQMLCTQLGDTIPPCKLAAPFPEKPRDCAEYVSDVSTCNNNIFSNVLVWETGDDDECFGDIAYFNIYVSNAVDGDYTYRASVKGTRFEDKDLPSFARCYRITAVDRSGNESEMSDPMCFENCPYYELPNVFSPNGDKCNDNFSAFGVLNPTSEDYQGTCVGTYEGTRSKCARFVQSVVFRVYNRWGKEVFTYSSGSERSIYINWDGRSNDGVELSSGIYYYVAEVTFDAIDPSIKYKTLKGWIHLLRDDKYITGQTD